MSEAVVKDTPARALGMVLAVAFACALLVSGVAVKLRPLQQANMEAERIAQLELVLLTLSEIGQATAIDSLDARIVELDSGAYDTSLDVVTWDGERAATRVATSVAIPAEFDLAGIKRREHHARVYLLHDDNGRVETVILPVRGSGYQSMLRAWLVMDGDGRTVRALKFYQHGETPGVGSRITEPRWEAQWRELPAYDDDGVLRIGVRIQGGGTDDDAGFRVDGISGATRTTQGVDGMIRFWLGDFGFAKYLRRISEEQS